jgi:hypothetical protein
LNERSDFVGPLDEAPMAHLRGLANGVRIEGVGHVAWTFLDCRGMLRTLKLPTYYVPTAGIRLLSMSSLLQEYPNEFLHADRTGLRLSGTFGAPVGGQRAMNGIQATLDPQTNLPVAYALDYDGSGRSSSSGSASNSSNRDPHRDSTGSNGASSPYGRSSQRGSSQRGGASSRSRSGSSNPRRGSRSNEHGTSKYSAGWRDSNDRDNGYTRASHPEDSKNNTQVYLQNLNLGCYSCQDTFCHQHSAYPSVTGDASSTDASNASKTSPSPPWGTVSAVNNNFQLTEAEKELSRWHFRLGHLSFRRIQFLMRSGALAASESARSLHTACA